MKNLNGKSIRNGGKFSGRLRFYQRTSTIGLSARADTCARKMDSCKLELNGRIAVLLTC